MFTHPRVVSLSSNINCRPLVRAATYTALIVGIALTGASHASAQDLAKQIRGLRKTVKEELSKPNQALATLAAKVSSSTATTTTTSTTTKSSTIANNKATTNYVSFDVFPGRRGNAVASHSGTGVGARFFLTEATVQIPENQRFKLEHTLFFPFEGRTADQKAADLHMISTCVQLYNQVLANPEGGTFYLLLNKDDKVGFACGSDLNVTYR